MSTTSTVCHQEVQPSVRLQLTPKPSNPDPQEKSHIGKTTETARFSFLHSFTTTTTIQTPKTETETEKVYVHPLAKRSASVLSPRSLAMCTENLGSETGSDVCSDEISIMLMNNNDIPLPSLETESKPTFLAMKQSCDEKSIDSVRAPKRLNRGVVNGGTNNFPPPLTSISVSSGIQFLPHREGGRLVLKAVPVTSPVNYFEAERSDGRLQLRFLRVSSSPEFDNEQVKEIGEEEEDEVVEEEEEEEEEEEDDDEVTEEMKTENETCWEDEEEEEEEVEEKSGNCETEEEGMEGNGGNVVGEMGMGKKLPRPSRCKESGRGSNNMVMNWPPESFWVAT